MNFNNILKEIEQADPEVYEKLSGRRSVLKSFGSKVALAALPIALGSMFKKAYGKDTGTVISTLNFNLQIEFFQYNFYRSALATGNNTTSTLIPAADRPGFQMIESQELEHITFLRSLITTMGGVPFTPAHYSGTNAATSDPYSPASYDFTGSNTYAVFNSYAVFLELAQTFEDLGVRAYLGQMPNLVANTNDVMEQMMQINSVEGRHASFIRLIRRFSGAVDYAKPLITNNAPPDVSLQPFYLGEDNTVQKGVNITALAGVSGTISESAATEAFDEPMDSTTVLSLLAPYIIS